MRLWRIFYLFMQHLLDFLKCRAPTLDFTSNNKTISMNTNTWKQSMCVWLYVLLILLSVIFFFPVKIYFISLYTLQLNAVALKGYEFDEKWKIIPHKNDYSDTWTTHRWTPTKEGKINLKNFLIGFSHRHLFNACSLTTSCGYQ